MTLEIWRPPARVCSGGVVHVNIEVHAVQLLKPAKNVALASRLVSLQDNKQQRYPWRTTPTNKGSSANIVFTGKREGLLSLIEPSMPRGGGSAADAVCIQVWSHAKLSDSDHTRSAPVILGSLTLPFSYIMNPPEHMTYPLVKKFSDVSVFCDL